MQHVYIPGLEWEEVKSPTGKFHSFYRNVSLALGGIRNTGTWGGGHPFDVQVRRIPSGASVCPYHLHLAQWELFIVQNGLGTVRTPEGLTSVKPGDVFFHPPGAAHQLTANIGNALEVLIISDHPPLDAFYYPDSNKWGLRPPGKYFRMAETDYFDGEDALLPTAGSYRPPPPTPAPAAPSFATRKLHPDDLPWESWDSPGKKFHGESKELSIALGAKRNTPVGLGGHPFDVELSKLLPGQCGCPFHSHAAQWEMFLIVSGTATIRAANDTHTLHADDVVLHPPGEPHQIINGSDVDELTFYLISDNPPVDYWHYPDSNKWGLRTPRKFFRTTDVDYYDGEE
jgi:uncharacterized cupin superfamily protein